MAKLRVFAVLCLLGAVLATAAAADEWQEGMMLADWLHSSAASTAKVMTSSSYERPDVKRVCLKEKALSNCKAVGCNVLNCDGSDCAACTPEWFAQSDLACGPTKDHDGYNQPSDTWAQLKVGSCDWQIRWFSCPPELEGRCGTDGSGDGNDGNYGFIQLDNKAIKFADVWATCYLNSDSEYCGEPLCDKQVLTFQGSAFAVYAQAESSYLTNPPPRDCMLVDDLPVLPNATRKARARGGPWQRLNSAMLGTSIGAKLRAERQAGATIPSRKAGRKDMTGGDDNSYGIETAPAYSSGAAYIFSGPVTVASMAKKVSYTRGMMEYVFDFIKSGDLPAGSVPPSNVLVVKPYTYDIALVGPKASPEYESHDSHGSEGGDHGYGYDRHEGEGYHGPEYDGHGERPYYEDGQGGKY